MRHRPTALTASADMRSQHAPRHMAKQMLKARDAASYALEQRALHNVERRAKLGSGERGDKVRTYREIDDRVSDVRSGRKTSLLKIRQGRLKLFW